MALTYRAAFTGLLVASALTSCTNGAGPSASPVGNAPPGVTPATPSVLGATQTSEGGQVTVTVTWIGPAAGPVFDVVFDTHSVALDALDLADAILRNDRGDTLTARPWSAPTGGHHRAGTLSLDGDAASFFASARWIELVLTGVGDLPERTLRWEVNL